MANRRLQARCLALLVCLGFLALPAFAMAQDHDTGFMLRYTAGASYARSGQKADLPGNPRYNISGAALDMDLAAGFALSENFAVHATGSFWRAFNPKVKGDFGPFSVSGDTDDRSEEHTSELQSRGHLVCRLLLEKKKIKRYTLFHMLIATG